MPMSTSEVEQVKDDALIGKITGKKLTEQTNGGACAWPRKTEPPPREGACWHVVHSDVRHAPQVIQGIERVGYEVYYPQMREMKVPALRHITASKRAQLKGIARPVLSPIFPGYQFVFFSLKDGQWHRLFDVFGVTGMIVTSGLPAPLNESVIRRIKGMEIGGAVPLETKVAQFLFVPGQTVRIDDGPFCGFNGTIQELDESKRRVLLEVLMFGRRTKTELELDQVVKL